MSLTDLAAWAGVLAIPITIIFGLVALRGVRIAQAQVELAASQNDMTQAEQQILTLERQYAAQVGLYKDLHEQCKREVDALQRDIARLQERHSLQRDELQEVRERNTELLTQLVLLQQRIERISPDS